MCERKQLTQEQIDLLNTPLPSEALKQHPSKSFLTTINAIYVTERLNQVFGVGSWQIHVDVVDNVGKMIVCKTTLEIPEYSIHYECFGGNDNQDKGDAYKGAVTDAITKIGSWLGIGAHVWRNEGTPNGKTIQQKPAEQQPTKKSLGRKPTAAEIKKVCDTLRACTTKEQVSEYWMKIPVEFISNDECTAVCKEVCAKFKQQ